MNRRHRMPAAGDLGLVDDGLSPATVLSDLSANIFAALLIILILLLQLKVAGEGRPQPVPPIDADLSLPVRPHAVLGVADVIALLRDQGRSGQNAEGMGTAFDLVETGVRPAGGAVTVPGRDIHDALGADAPGVKVVGAKVVEAKPGSNPVRLYIFSNRWFAEATAALTHAGRTWRDLSVPRALRDPADPQAWSRDFLRLAATGGDLATFRGGLARLLAATPAPLVPHGYAAAADTGISRAATAASGTWPPLPFSTFRHVAALTVAGLALTSGIALIGIVEFAFREHVPDHSPTFRRRP